MFECVSQTEATTEDRRFLETGWQGGARLTNRIRRPNLQATELAWHPQVGDAICVKKSAGRGWVAPSVCVCVRVRVIVFVCVTMSQRNHVQSLQTMHLYATPRPHLSPVGCISSSCLLRCWMQMVCLSHIGHTHLHVLLRACCMLRVCVCVV
jgi:hypothetical protein